MPRKSLKKKQLADKERLRVLRLNEEFTAAENAQRAERLQREREDADFNAQDKVRRNLDKSIQRKDPDFHAKDNQRRNADKANQREDPDFHAEDNQRRNADKSIQREDPDFRAKDNQRRNADKSIQREDPDFLAKDKARRNEAKSTQRQNKDFIMTENNRRSERLANKRKDAEFNAQDKVRRNMNKADQRQDKDFTAAENTRRSERLANKRKDAEFNAQDKVRRNMSKADQRQNKDFTAAENTRRSERLDNQRKDAEFNAKDKLRRNKDKSTQRQNNDFRAAANVVRAAALKVKRKNPHFYVKDNLRRRISRQNERSAATISIGTQIQTPKSNDQRTKENVRRANSIRARRSINSFRTNEQKNDTARRSLARKDPVRRRLDFDNTVRSNRKKREQQTESFESLLKKYNKLIKQGPTFICSCCGSTLYEQSTSKTSREKLEGMGLQNDFLDKVLYYRQTQDRLCFTCLNYIKKNKIPRLALSNGLDFPEIPDAIKGLNRLEQRLVSPRLPFMQIRPKGHEHQSALKGNVVNVENNLNKCVRVLPRQFSETDVIQIKLMRRSCYRGHYLYDKVRPAKVVAALRHLLDTPLYKKANIAMSEHWNQLQDEEVDFLVDNDNDDTDMNESTTGNETSNAETAETDNIGAEETLLMNERDLNEYGKRVAPAEGNIPIPLNRDPEAELLSFPSVYVGQERVYNKEARLSYTDIAKSELRRYDRRCAFPEKILYMYKKSSNEKIYNAYNICLRQKKKGFGGKPLTAADVRSEQSIQKNVIIKDDGYSVFKNIRSSPAYWREQTKRVVAMVRQLGNCSVFLTLSAAETKWNELLVMLSKLVENKDITEEEAEEMDYDHKAFLIRSDPVTCMRHFDHKYRALLHNLFKKENGVFRPNKVTDYYSRVEFQMRGSPHSHGLYWLNNAPKYIPGDAESEAKVIEFVDKYITCKRDESGEMEKLIGYQIHNHSHTCKKGKSVENCRFGYPKPPLPSTTIVHPLPNDFDKKKKKEATEAYQKIHLKLVQMGRNFKEDINFPDFLASVEMDEDTYMLALRSSVKRSSVFLRRKTNGIFINNYNRDILVAWKANMDIQFVLDSYACAKYCVGYMLKAEGGVSKLLRAACREARLGNTSIADKLQQFAKILINGTEISAQEAVAFLLGLQNTFASRVDVYVNTSKAEDRIGILKPQEELKALDDDSEDICEKNMIDHYLQRPPELEDTCLADFCCLYQFRKTKPGSYRAPNNSEDEEEDISNDNADIGVQKSFKLLDSSGYVTKRTVRKILRFRHFNKTDQVQYWREQLMLFIPWRDETSELVNINSIEKANEVMERIKTNSKPYYDNNAIDDGLLHEYITEIEDTENGDGETEEIVENDMQLIDDDNYAASFLTGKPSKGSAFEKFLPPKWIPNNEYAEIMQTLNDKQRRIVMEVAHRLKEDKEPFHIFLTGGAGVGKSRVITAITQSYLRFCNKFADLPPEDINVIVSAPTGKAAFNVSGMTLHTAFKIPPNQRGGSLPKLDGSTLNTLRIKFRHTKLFIIDEISMVSCGQLGKIDQRLREIFNSELPFGGKSILVVGHFRQLPPIPGGRKHYAFLPPPCSRSALVARNPLWEIFEFYELTEIMRQRGEDQLLFCKALNNMAEGIMDTNDISLLQSREIEPNDLLVPEKAIWLFQTNAECSVYNKRIHDSMNTEGAASLAHDRVTGEGNAFQKQKILKDAELLTTQESDGIPYCTHLQVEGVYFVTTNVDVSDGLFNGATGILKSIEYSTTVQGQRIPTTAWLHFDNPIIGQNARKSPRCLQRCNQQEINVDWTPIERVTRTLSVSYMYPGMELIRTQIPLLAANGMTIAKAQGSSLNSVVVCTRTNLTREKLYVACSRATSLNGLFIDGEFEPPSKPENDDVVTLEMVKLRQNPVVFSHKFFSDIQSSFKLYFHNVENFISYRKNVSSDPNIMSSNLIAFVEPHIHDGVDVDLPGFVCTSRKNSIVRNDRTNSVGHLIYHKQGLHPPVVSSVCKMGQDNAHYGIMKIDCGNILVLACYRHKKFSPSVFLHDLENEITSSDSPVCVVGDINLDLIKNRELDVRDFFAKLGLRNILGEAVSTTIHGTYIDVCFSNHPNIKAFVSDTYYSVHEAICVYLE